MHRVWSDKARLARPAPRSSDHFCLGVWYYQHARIQRFVESLPPDRGLRVRSEDVLE